MTFQIIALSSAIPNIPHGDSQYMGHLALINYGRYNFVTGKNSPAPSAEKNIIIPAGFPHQNAMRLHGAVSGNYEQLHDANSLAYLSGQRRRWNDNINEATAETVIWRTAAFTGYDTSEFTDRAAIEQWMQSSPFAREQQLLPEGKP